MQNLNLTFEVMEIFSEKDTHLRTLCGKLIKICMRVKILSTSLFASSQPSLEQRLLNNGQLLKIHTSSTIP